MVRRRESAVSNHEAAESRASSFKTRCPLDNDRLIKPITAALLRMR
jgi:hypothetical protein